MNTQETAPKPEEKKKSNLKKVLYVLLALLLILLAALIYYLITQRPITRVLPGVSAAPRYIKSAYGEFGSITDVAISKNGNRIYAVDGTNNKIWVLDPEGKVLTSFGATYSIKDLDGFANPQFIAVGPKDELYITDRDRAKIFVFSPTGKFVKYFTPKADVAAGTEWSPLAIAVDINGDVYLCDAKKGENRIMIFDKDGKVLRTFGKSGLGKGQFAYPNGISVTKDRIFVADSSNARVQAFDKKGKYLFSFRPGQGTEVTHPVGIDATRGDEVLVVESFGFEVQAYNLDGGELYKFGTSGIGDGQFRYPTGIAVSASGRVYIADRGSNRIQIWQY